MENLYKIINLDIKDKTGNLKAEAHSEVKSTKYFPTYLINGKNMIFKPLSKTKPLTTPLFAYSEVFWSYVIKEYFDELAPRYYLAKVKGMSEEQEKYSEYGVLVESLTKDGEDLINLYDFFSINPDKNVNIKNYINYCMQSYDYTSILTSKYFQNNNQGERLAFQILLSILRQDQNFHYENVLLKKENNVYCITPPIDFEFSTPFLYPDMPEKYHTIQENYKTSIMIKIGNKKQNDIIRILLTEGLLSVGKNTKNICLIVRRYPEMVRNFISQLDSFIADLPKIQFSDPDNFIGLLNSDYWTVGHALYKERDCTKYKQLASEIQLHEIDKEKLFKQISKDILEYSKFFSLLLKTYLLAYYKGCDNLENLTIIELLDMFKLPHISEISDINLEDLSITLKRTKNSEAKLDE